MGPEKNSSSFFEKHPLKMPPKSPYSEEGNYKSIRLPGKRDNDIYDNAFRLENYLIEQFGKALSNAEEDAFINGTGVGQPLGILAATGGAEVGKTTAGASVTADDVIDLVYSLKRPYRKKAVFLTNDKCVAALRKLKDENGQYLWQPALQAGAPRPRSPRNRSRSGSSRRQIRSLTPGSGS